LPPGDFGTASCAPWLGTQNEPDARKPCGQLPPGPGGFGCGSGSAKAAVADNSAKMMMADFNGAIHLLGSSKK
jgi:hypothetical protein